MKKIKILHVADIHIGYTTHGRINPKTGMNTRVEDFARCLREAAAAAISEDVDIVLIAGDIYRDTTPSQSDQRAFAEAIMPIINARIPIVMVTGNHDNPVAFGKTATTEIFGVLAGVKVMSSPTASTIDTKSGPVYIMGMPWPTPSLLKANPKFSDASREDLNAVILKQYEQWIDVTLNVKSKTQASTPVIIAGHLEVHGAKLTEGSERPALQTKDAVFPVSMLARSEVDYVALGHIHMHQDLNPGSRPPVVYPGSVERISFNEESQPKGYVIAEVWRGGCEYRHVPTHAREMVTVDVELTEDTLLPEHDIMEAISKTATPESIVRVRITCSEAQRKDIRASEIRKIVAGTGADACAGIEITVTDKSVRSRAPELKRDMSVFDALGTYLGTIGMPEPEQSRLIVAATELEPVDDE